MRGNLPFYLLALACAAGTVAQHRLSPEHFTGATAIDGDTFISSAGAHYRLADIDAPELSGHCQGWRERHGTCAPGNPYAARAALQLYLNAGINCRREERLDYYRRILARCWLRDGRSVNQLLIKQGFAVKYNYQGRN